MIADKKAKRLIRALLKALLYYTDAKYDKDCTCDVCKLRLRTKRALREKKS